MKNIINLTQVDYQYHIIGILNHEQALPVLIDTGASFSQINKEYVVNRFPCEKIYCLNFEGKTRVYEEKTRINLDLSGKQEFGLEIYIDDQPNKLLLGIDFLDSLDYSITRDYIMLDGIKHRRFRFPEERMKSIIDGN